MEAFLPKQHFVSSLPRGVRVVPREPAFERVMERVMAWLLGNTPGRSLFLQRTIESGREKKFNFFLDYSQIIALLFYRLYSSGFGV